MCVISAGKLRSFTPEIKQLTGVESCQCRKGRIQRNHINCAMLGKAATHKVARSLVRKKVTFANSGRTGICKRSTGLYWKQLYHLALILPLATDCLLL
jgi:hypothetical protein